MAISLQERLLLGIRLGPHLRNGAAGECELVSGANSLIYRARRRDSRQAEGETRVLGGRYGPIRRPGH